jgi:hypothetical protein
MKKRKERETTTWAINGFPAKLRNRYISSVKAKGMFIKEHLEYLITKFLREENDGPAPDIFS